MSVYLPNDIIVCQTDAGCTCVADNRQTDSDIERCVVVSEIDYGTLILILPKM